MEFTIDSLSQAGAFTGAPVEKTIKWDQDGEELSATVYVRRMSYSQAVSDVRGIAGKHDAIAGRIASSICNEVGKPVFTAEDITGEADPERGPLNHHLTMALLQVIGEVNAEGKMVSSGQKKKSGTS